MKVRSPIAIAGACVLALLAGVIPASLAHSSARGGLPARPSVHTASLPRFEPDGASFISANTGWVLMGASCSSCVGALLATSDGGAQWNALYALWQQESGWSNTARNKGSGAYGIAQALPPTKYPLAAQASGGSNPKAQIQWGLGYIKGRYGSPEGALAHEDAFGWY